MSTLEEAIAAARYLLDGKRWRVRVAPHVQDLPGAAHREGGGAMIPLFAKGAIATTEGASRAIARHAVRCDASVGHVVEALLERHTGGDWGEVCPEDASANDRAVRTGARILSVYRVGGVRVWTITEADRSVTTFLLPEEY